MLASLVGLLVSAGPLLRGSWDPWAQSVLFCAVVLGFGAWVAARALIGYVPIPPIGIAAWAGGLAALALLSAWLSPVSSYAIPSWRALALGLWIFPAVAVASKDERALVDEGIRAAAWTLTLLAFYQRFHDGVARPASALLNENIFAGAILLFLPLAISKRDWLLAAALAICLWWCHSVGAWIGLAGALILMRRSSGSVGYWTGVLIAACGLVAVCGKLQSPPAADRWAWWTAAARMAAARPWLGFGPGTFGYVLPGFQAESWGISTLFAHQHLLEIAAECGLPFLAIWLAGLVAPLRHGGAHKRFGALALLIQSLWDYGLSIPANLWLFCYFVASSSPEHARGLNVSARAKLPLAGAALGAALLVAAWSQRLWQADRYKTEASELLLRGDAGARAAELLERSTAIIDDAEAERLAGEADLRLWGETHAGLIRAAGHFRRAASLNPYRPSNWSALALLAQRLGDASSAQRFLADGSRYCPSLRGTYAPGAGP